MVTVRRGCYPDRAFELLVTWRGNVAAVHRQLAAEGGAVPDMETLRRAIARELSLAQRDYITDGDDGVRKRAVYLRHEARFRGECYEGDHKQLSIEVLAPRATRPQRPWATLFVDQFSRLIVGWALSLQPTAAEVLAAVRMAVLEDPEHPFGGVPARLRWDHGHEFGADAVEQAGAVLGCVSVCCEPYSPWQKGKIERLNRTLEDELLRGLPRWTAGPRDKRGELVGEAPLTLAYLSVLFADYVERYNTRRGHSALGGLTPLQAWQSDSTPLQQISVKQARWMLKARQERVIAKDGTATATGGDARARCAAAARPRRPTQPGPRRRGRRVSATHHLGLDGARVIETRELQLAEQAVADLVELHAMGVLYGPAGSGKTFAAALAGRRLAIARVNVQFPSRPTMLHVAQHLTRAVTGTLPPRRRNRFELSDELIDALSDERRLVVVDEAQWLNRECIEYLRHLHDHPDTRFALLLVGGDGCWEVLSREPMLRSRIHRQVRFSAMDLATVLQVIPRYHPVYADTPAEVIADIDDRYAHGIFRHWASFTHSALAHATAPLNARVAGDLLELHATGQRAA